MWPPSSQGQPQGNQEQIMKTKCQHLKGKVHQPLKGRERCTDRLTDPAAWGKLRPHSCPEAQYGLNINMTWKFCRLLKSQSKEANPTQLEELPISSLLPQFQLEINCPAPDVQWFQQHWRPCMALAVILLWVLTWMAQQLTVGQEGGSCFQPSPSSLWGLVTLTAGWAASPCIQAPAGGEVGPQPPRWGCNICYLHSIIQKNIKQRCWLYRSVFRHIKQQWVHSLHSVSRWTFSPCHI